MCKKNTLNHYATTTRPIAPQTQSAKVDHSRQCSDDAAHIGGTACVLRLYFHIRQPAQHDTCDAGIFCHQLLLACACGLRSTKHTAVQAHGQGRLGIAPARAFHGGNCSFVCLNKENEAAKAAPHYSYGLPATRHRRLQASQTHWLMAQNFRSTPRPMTRFERVNELVVTAGAVPDVMS